MWSFADCFISNPPACSIASQLILELFQAFLSERWKAEVSTSGSGRKSCHFLLGQGKSHKKKIAFGCWLIDICYSCRVVGSTWLSGRRRGEQLTPLELYSSCPHMLTGSSDICFFAVKIQAFLYNCNAKKYLIYTQVLDANSMIQCGECGMKINEFDFCLLSFL